MSDSPFQSLMSLGVPTNGTLPDFVNLDPKYVCPLCKEVLKAPVQTECGHRTCKECMDKYLAEKSVNGEAPCPIGDGETCLPIKPDTIVPDFSGKREIERLNVFCKYKSNGCLESVPWRLLDRHSRTCGYRSTECPYKEFGCNDMILDQDFDQHTRNECQYRPEQCGYCNQHIPVALLQPHIENNCPNVQISCPNKCGEVAVFRRDMPAHLDRCPAMPSHCTFRSLGCKFTGSPDELKRHESMKAIQHQELQQKYIERLETMMAVEHKELEDLRTHAKKQEETIKTIRRTMAQQSEKIIDLEEKVSACANKEAVAQQGRDLRAVQDAQGKAERRLVSIERERSEQQRQGTGHLSEEIRQQIIRHDKQVSIHDMRLREMEMRFQCLETTSYEGMLIWKIREYSRRKHEAVLGKTLSLYSQPFYTSRYGYKMCARVYLNGDGIGKGSHMSLFFVLMKGDYDPLLPWPFKSKVVFTLLDQETGRKNMQDTFRPDPTSSSFRKPSGEMNVATGCPLFVAHSVVESRPYLVDDTIYIKIQIENNTTSLP